MIRACVFDLDGTLANTLESMAHAANILLKEYGFRELPTENFKYYCGDGASVLVRRVLKDAGDEDLEYYEKMEPAYRTLFGKDPVYRAEPYPGMIRILDRFRKEGVKLAVCSNKPHEATLGVIRSLFGERFDAVLGQKPEIAKKPAPDGALLLARTLGVNPEECLYIGDTHTDMETGNSAGMHTAGVLWGYRTREELETSGAEFLVRTPDELWDICRSFQEKDLRRQEPV